MNRLTGKIVLIESSAEISIVDIEADGNIFSAVVLEIPKTSEYLKIGQPVEMFFKETEVAIAKNLSGQISLRNRVRSEVVSIKTQGVLTEVTLDFEGVKIISIISSRSAVRLELKEGDQVEWLVKTSEVSLRPI